MEPEDKKLLQQTFDLAQENHKLLKKIRRVQNMARVWKIIYWLIIVSLAFGAYYYLQPLVAKISGIFKGLGGGLEKISEFGQDLPDMETINQILDQAKPK